MYTKSLKGQSLHQTITTINYKSLITSDKREDVIPSYMKTKCKYKIRKAQPFLPYLHTREPSLPTIKSPQMKHNNHSCVTMICVPTKVKERSISIANDTFFYKTRQASFLDNLLKQLKQKKQH